MNLTPTFITNITNAFGAEGQRYLADLPNLLDEAARRWELTLGEPFLLSYNYVCAATRLERSATQSKDVVLKIGVPNRELTSEMEALRLYNGRGAVRLIDSDAERGMILLERLRPGTMLVELQAQDDAQATEIAAGVMKSMWNPPPAQNHFIQLTDWFGELKHLRPRFNGMTGPLPKQVVETAEGYIRELFAENEPPVVLHGDFHHYNVLKSGDEWLVIDPKGVIGARGYEVGPLLTNPLLGYFGFPNEKRRTERRLAILAERLELEREYLRRWGVAHCLLSGWWDLDEHGAGWEDALHWAEVLMECRQ
ncbi:MAG: aminoglycoside/hydroxyurea antibiotic resistance kinase [Chloroflexi bacterium]|nr:MAG: aminoglycoside/hydroxyurea antibiotic resistance kinase [Chloroflexota bacterium]